MSRYLVYIDAPSKAAIDEMLGAGLDNWLVEEYFTLTEDGEPIVFDRTMVGDPDFCNGLAIRCAGITEE